MLPEGNPPVAVLSLAPVTFPSLNPVAVLSLATRRTPPLCPSVTSVTPIYILAGESLSRTGRSAPTQGAVASPVPGTAPAISSCPSVVSKQKQFSPLSKRWRSSHRMTRVRLLISAPEVPLDSIQPASLIERAISPYHHDDDD